MSTMASQIISLTSVYSSVYSRRKSKKTTKLHLTGLYAGNSPVTGEFPFQRASNTEMFPFDDVIMVEAEKSTFEAFLFHWRTLDSAIQSKPGMN